MGVPLKRKNFKWRQKERMSSEDLKLKRSMFWETCHNYGVNKIHIIPQK